MTSPLHSGPGSDPAERAEPVEASDPYVQAESPGPEPATPPQDTTPPAVYTGRPLSMAVAGAVLFAFMFGTIAAGTMAAFSADADGILVGGLVAAAAGLLVGAVWAAVNPEAVGSLDSVGSF
ncbi:MAG: hypothetical protein QOJ19_2692 [Acidimicrobiia bacterium]|nr:hypothetical protein [Acidimicrobiia bacterium]